MRKNLKRYDIPGHAHELTFSCYHRYDYLKDQMACSIFLDELSQAKERFKFKIWAYVLMPNHVHLLIYPEMNTYKIAVILKHIKGKTSTRYRAYIINQKPYKYDTFCVTLNGKKIFRFWQRGGGYDRNLWSAKAIHSSINYIEGNPIRADLVEVAKEWPWSSARARITGENIVPDSDGIPFK